MTPSTATTRPAPPRPAHDIPARPADRWRVTDPARYARYIAALELIHRDELRGARDWLGVEASIAASGRLVVARGERAVSEAIRDEAVSSPAAFRQQIVELARRVA